MVSEEPVLADAMLGGPLARVVFASLYERLHAVAVGTSHVAVVGFWGVRLRHPPEMRVAVSEAVSLDGYPLGRGREARGVEADKLLAESQVGFRIVHEADLRLEVQERLHRTARHPRVAHLDHDGSVIGE